MSGQCTKHPWDPAGGVCRECGNEFCERCLVYSFGGNKPPFCVACAIACAGIRKKAANTPSMPKNLARQMEKERRKNEKLAARAAKKAPVPEIPPYSVLENPTVIPPPAHVVPSRSPAASAGWSRA